MLGDNQGPTSLGAADGGEFIERRPALGMVLPEVDAGRADQSGDDCADADPQRDQPDDVVAEHVVGLDDFIVRSAGVPTERADATAELPGEHLALVDETLFVG
ncbi:MAG: hypothetical protein DI534_11360 [Leifsonia xyli]|nr:MAG: hypothetical protein DI534_11360 [Leifsonia xyli]